MVHVSVEDVLLTPLKRISTPGGDVLHAMKTIDTGFNGFGECYFSWIETGSVKAWKCHTQMTMNLVVPVGQVRFVFHSEHHQSFREIELGEQFYARITVPPGIWFGFQGTSSSPSLVLNIANIEHDPNEVKRLLQAEINYIWN